MTIVFKSGKELEVNEEFGQMLITNIGNPKLPQSINTFYSFRKTDNDPIMLVINISDISHIKPSVENKTQPLEANK